MCPPNIPGPFSHPHIKFHLPATIPISCLARRTHTSSARRPRDCVYITLYIYFTYYALWNAKHRSGHLIRLMPMNWRWRHDAISSIRQSQAQQEGRGEGEREHIYWNCENQKFHSFSYKSVNVCHLSKSLPSPHTLFCILFIVAWATHTAWSEIQLQLWFAYELKTST